MNANSHCTMLAERLPEVQYLALFDLYNATNGANWFWAEPFDEYGVPWEFTETADPCVDDWQGVVCSNSSASNASTITGLNLDELNLFGTIPPSINGLSDLQSLILSNNQLYHTIPSTIGNLTKLNTLDLSYNYLMNPMPSTLGNMTQLQSLSLYNNLIRGFVPPWMCQLSALTQLDLGVNEFSGSLPACIGDLALLQEFAVGDNVVSGELPSSMANLVLLTRMDVGSNRFNGTVPAFLENFTHLKYLSLGTNFFTGTVPAFLGNNSALRNLYLNANFFEGPIPPSLGRLASLELLALQVNFFTGPLPKELCNLCTLTELTLQFNYLTSTIPACVGAMTNLTFLSLQANKLHGSIPDSFGGLVHLETLYLDNNRLTHSIPSSLGDLPRMTILVLFRNHLTGPIPSGIWNMYSLEYLYLNDNHLTGLLPNFSTPLTVVHVNLSANHLVGNIPASIANYDQMVVLGLAGNLLTGTIPASLATLRLASLQLSENFLTGTIPKEFSLLTGLVVLALKSNQLTGPLSGVFTAEQENLISVQLDDNQFTGELPSVLFDLPALISLSIVGSCLHGTLPSNICNAVQMEALVLYGLTTGASCRAAGANALSIYREEFGGALPKCVLRLPKLRSLLLASNGLTGRMSDSWNVSHTLLQLDLSHNLLVGTIASSIQNHSWSLLDLSHNKLSGVLSSGFFAVIPNVTLYQAFPDEIIFRKNFTLPDLQIVAALDTNRLSGRVPNHLKPLRDLNLLAGNLFQCGCDKSDLPQHDTDISNYECASNSFNLSIFVWLAFVAIAVIGALFAWYSGAVFRLAGSLFVSADAFFPACNVNWRSGEEILKVYDAIVKTALYCTAFCLLILLPYYAVMSHFEGTHTHQYAYVLSAIYTSGAIVFALDVVLWTALLALLPAVNHTTMQLNSQKQEGEHVSLPVRVKVWTIFAVLNIVTVLGVNVAFVYTVLYQSTAAQSAAQVLLSLFKLGWSTAVSPWMIRQLDNYFIPVSEGPAEPFFTLQLLVALFNNIAIPCLVVMAVDPNCFNYILLPTEPETVYYLQPVCAEDLEQGLQCVDVFYKRSSLTFTPPFTYSYQCSASFITAYAPTFVYMSIATVFVNPPLRYAMSLVHGRLRSETRLKSIFSAILPRILQAPPTEPILSGNKRERPLFRAVGILVTLLMQLGVLLTFGAIFPPVALAMAVSIVATVYTARWELHRFIQTLVDADLLHCLVTLDANCSNVGTSEQMMRAAKIIVCYCFAFYTLFLFDTLGDTQGFRATLWVLIVVPLSPPLLFYCHNLYVVHATRLSGVDSKCVNRTSSIEVGGTNQALYSESDAENKRVETMNVIHATM